MDWFSFSYLRGDVERYRTPVPLLVTPQQTKSRTGVEGLCGELLHRLFYHGKWDVSTPIFTLFKPSRI